MTNLMMIECEATLTEWKWAAIEEPFNLHVGITNRSQLAVKLELLHFLEVTDVLDVSHETRRLPLFLIINVFWGEHDLLAVLLQSLLHLGGKVHTRLHALGNLGHDHH